MKCPATPPITAPFAHPASDGPDNKTITASIAAAATSIDFINLLLLDRAWIRRTPIKVDPPAAAQSCRCAATGDNGIKRQTFAHRHRFLSGAVSILVCCGVNDVPTLMIRNREM